MLFPLRHIENGKWGYTDARGRFVIPPMYDWASPFEEGLAAVGLDGSYRFINMRNEIQFGRTFEYIMGGFDEGFAGMASKLCSTGKGG